MALELKTNNILEHGDYKGALMCNESNVCGMTRACRDLLERSTCCRFSVFNFNFLDSRFICTWIQFHICTLSLCFIFLFQLLAQKVVLCWSTRSSCNEPKRFEGRKSRFDLARGDFEDISLARGDSTGKM